MNTPSTYLNMQTSSAKTFIWIWILTLLSVIALIICSIIFAQKYSAIPVENFGVQRLHRIQDNGIVAVGTSLTMYGFPYDEVMDKKSQKIGIHLQFVRFSLSSGQANQFIPLLNPILTAKPKWVFLQIGPFISIHGYPLSDIVFDANQFLNFFLLGKQPVPSLKNSFEETDQQCADNINKIATSVEDSGDTHFSQNPTLSPEYQQFLLNAKQQGIHVVFLQITRSTAYQTKQGKYSLQAEHHAMVALANKYHLPLWISPALPLEYYIDGGHLNTQGRAIFTQWFLQRLKNASMDR